MMAVTSSPRGWKSPAARPSLQLTDAVDAPTLLVGHSLGVTVSLDDADHLLTDPADATYAATVIAAWSGRYVHGTQTGATTSADPAEFG